MKIARSIFFTVSVIWGLSTILFILFRWVIDPTQMLAGQRVDSQTLQNIRRELGLDLPLYLQYLNYLNDLSPIGIIKDYHQGYGFIGSLGIKFPFLGVSFFYKENVWNLFTQHVFATFLLATLAVILAFFGAYFTGKFLYLRNIICWTSIVKSVSNFLIALPSFVISILLLWWFSLEWNLFPISGYFVQKDVLTLRNYVDLSYLVLPIIASALRPYAIFLLMLLQLLEEEEQKEYVKTAKSKGLSRSAIYEQHIFPNILLTLISVFFNWWASLLAGSFFIEYIFDYPGIGKLLVESILQNDYPMVSGLCLITAVMFLIINTINEILVIRYRVS